MTLLRRVLGETLRGRRLRQRRTLREVSGAARVSLGYLSEVERGQKEASSELLASICDALDVKLSDLLREVSETMLRSERAAEVARVPGRALLPAGVRTPVPAGAGTGPARAHDEPAFDGAQFDGAGFGTGEFDNAQFDGAGFDGAFEDAFAGSQPDGNQLDGLGAPAPGEPVAGSDGVAAEPVELDGVDLAELETGDGFGEVEVLLGLTDLAPRTDGPYAARCLAAAAA